MMRRKTLEEFIDESTEKHCGKYDYSEVEYKNLDGKVKIICPVHGSFWQSPRNHLFFGQGCPACGNERRSVGQMMSLADFVSKAVERHGDRYDYSKAVYKGSKRPLEIVCPVHGAFWQRPNDHLGGKGCPVCGGRTKSIEQFIHEAKSIHGDKYDYSEVGKGYGDEKVSIRCLKCGNIFTQKPWSHLQGHGCPYCIKSRLEEEIEAFLASNGIVFEREKKFEWLGRLSLDFFLPTYNVAIECQGEQHFNGSRCFGHKEMEATLIDRDKRKYGLCKDNGIEVLYYVNGSVPNDYIGFITNDKDILLSNIISR